MSPENITSDVSRQILPDLQDRLVFSVGQELQINQTAPYTMVQPDLNVPSTLFQNIPADDDPFSELQIRLLQDTLKKNNRFLDDFEKLLALDLSGRSC